MNRHETPTGLATLAVAKLYLRHPTGGLLHIVTDDLNTSTSNLYWCASPEAAISRSMDGVETMAYKALLPLSTTARTRACTQGSLLGGLGEAAVNKWVADSIPAEKLEATNG